MRTIHNTFAVLVVALAACNGSNGPMVAERGLALTGSDGSGATAGSDGSGATAGSDGSGATAGSDGSGATAGSDGSGATAGSDGSGATAGSDGSGATAGSDGSGGSGAPPAPPAPPPPTSTIEITYDDGNPTSMFPTSPSVSQRCWIPKEILADKPIFPGDPKMTSCDITTTVVGQPPTSMSMNLYCGNGPGAAYDYFTCSDSLTFVPPNTSTTGYISYGSGKTLDLDAATCAAYITRALSICQVTGKQQ